MGNFQPAMMVGLKGIVPDAESGEYCVEAAIIFAGGGLATSIKFPLELHEVLQINKIVEARKKKLSEVLKNMALEKGMSVVEFDNEIHSVDVAEKYLNGGIEDDTATDSRLPESM